MNKKFFIALVVSSIMLSCAAKKLPITEGDYTGEDAAQIVVIRQIGGTKCEIWVKVDDEGVCELPEWGNWSKFTLAPGVREFEAFCNERGAKWEPKMFTIEANGKYFFRIHHALENFVSPKMKISEIPELKANNLISQKDRYIYVPPKEEPGKEK